jgi:hypothetical protein
VCMSVCVCWARQAELFVDPADKEDLPEVFDDLDMWVCWTCICVRVYMEERRRRGGEGGYLSPSQVLMAVCVCVCVCVCACVCVCVCVCVCGMQGCVVPVRRVASVGAELRQPQEVSPSVCPGHSSITHTHFGGP